MTAIQDRTKLIVGIDYGTTYSGTPFSALVTVMSVTDVALMQA